MLSSVLLSLVVLVAPPAPESGSTTYANERYGYRLELPTGLTGQGESGSGDGQEFVDPSGQARLKVWASRVVEVDETPEGRMDLAWARRASLERWREDGIRVTYQPRGKGWWVLSGEDAKGRVFYLKQLEKDGVLYGFEWSHPQGAKRWRDATARIARGFKPP